MRQSLKTLLTYAAAFAAAVGLHLALATLLGGVLRSSDARVGQAELPMQEEPLAVTFRRPEPVALEPRPAPAVTRLREPAPAPTPEPIVEEPLPEEPPAPEPETVVSQDLVPSEEPSAEIAETPPRIQDTRQPPQSGGPPLTRAFPASARAPAVSPVQIVKPRPLAPIDTETVYPLGSRLRGEEGAVRLRIAVDAKGRVEILERVESSGFAALDRAAERAVRQTRFAPASRNGRPVADELTIIIRFRLDS